MRFVNLTPHKINIIIPSGDEIAIPPSGEVARVASVDTPRPDIRTSVTGIPVTHRTYRDPVGLPDPQEGVVYVVSGIVLIAVPDRDDIFAPGDLIRDDNGQPIGCRGLLSN